MAVKAWNIRDSRYEMVFDDQVKRVRMAGTHRFEGDPVSDVVVEEKIEWPEPVMIGPKKGRKKGE